MPRGDGKELGEPRLRRKTGPTLDPPVQSKRLRRRLNDDRPGEVDWSKVRGKYVDVRNGDGHLNVRMHRPGSQKRS